jgi:hypothetical protein
MKGFIGSRRDEEPKSLGYPPQTTRLTKHVSSRDPGLKAWGKFCAVGSFRMGFKPQLSFY